MKSKTLFCWFLLNNSAVLHDNTRQSRGRAHLRHLLLGKTVFLEGSLLTKEKKDIRYQPNQIWEMTACFKYNRSHVIREWTGRKHKWDTTPLPHRVLILHWNGTQISDWWAETGYEQCTVQKIMGTAFYHHSRLNFLHARHVEWEMRPLSRSRFVANSQLRLSLQYSCGQQSTHNVIQEAHNPYVTGLNTTN